MNFQFYLEKLHSSDDFKNFMKKNPDAYLCSGFFIIDKENLEHPDNKTHFDYFLPKEKKIISFQLEEKMQQIPIDLIDKKIPSEVSIDHDFDFDEIEGLILKKMGQQGIKNKLQKMIISLQKIEREEYLVGTVFISGLGMLKVRIKLPEKQITLFEKKSFFDMMKVMKKGEK